MKKRNREQKLLFTLLMAAAVVAIAAGVYLGVILGMQIQASVTLLATVGILLWTVAWGSFLLLCLRLCRGESAFTPATGKTLSVISRCMAGLAAVSFICAVIAAALGRSRSVSFLVIEAVLLPGFFLAAAAAAKILRGLLVHAMAIEKEQEGVV
nr:hypothetical protein [Clostridia bacterium]